MEENPEGSWLWGFLKQNNLAKLGGQWRTGCATAAHSAQLVQRKDVSVVACSSTPNAGRNATTCLLTMNGGARSSFRCMGRCALHYKNPWQLHIPDVWKNVPYIAKQMLISTPICVERCTPHCKTYCNFMICACTFVLFVRFEPVVSL